MALSAALNLCLFGGTNFHLTDFVVRYFLIAVVASLSSTLNFGLNHLASKYVKNLSNAVIMELASRSGRGRTKIAFVV